MATFTAIVTFEVTIEVECKDSQLKTMLFKEYFKDWVEDAINDTKAVGKENYVTASCGSVDVLEIADICKENGDSYEWGGDKLTKEKF